MTDTPAPKPLGRQLRQLRLQAGLSQEALSEASGISVRTISDLERGQRQSSHPETLRLLANALDLTSEDRLRLIESARPDAVQFDERSSGFPRTPFGPTGWGASIPKPATPLVGRTVELDELGAWLSARTGDIVTLTGPGGVGKTRLAIEVADRLSPTYADGAAFVDLATVTQAGFVPDAIARALGVSPRSGSGTGQLAALLASRELLLVLDNLEQVIAAASIVAELNAACPDLTILVTSRIRLRVSSERAYFVPPLALAAPKASIEESQISDALQLFAQRARRVDPQFELSDRNSATVADICRRVDGLPLAIELAASRLRVLPLPVLRDRLDRHLSLLTGGDRDRPSRQQSMRETIAWSYDLLQPIEQRMLCWIAVFAGGLSIDSAEHLGSTIGLDADASLEAITTLVESGLATRSGLTEGELRFRLYETIREFGMERLTETGELAAARRFHAEHFLAFASAEAPPPHAPIPVAWVGRLATEYANLLTAFDVLCVPETAEQSLEFAAAMGPYWHSRGPFSDWLPRLRRAIDLASPAPTIVKVNVLNWLTLILGASPDFPAALEAAHRGIEMANQVGSTSDRAGAIHITAWVYECHEQWETARELRNQAIELWTSVGNTYMHAMCLAMNARSAYELGDLERAQRESEVAAAMFREAGIIDWLGSIECTQGTFAVAAGQFALGAELFERSLRTCTQGESWSRWYRPLVGLADVAAAIGQVTTGARLLGAADEMLIVGGRDLPNYDRPAYTRADARCRETLGSIDFEQHRRAGSLMSSDDWLVDAERIVAAASEANSSVSA